MVSQRRLISSGSSFEKAGGYSRAIVDGDWVFVSGTTGFDYAKMTIPYGLEDQVHQTFRNIAAALKQAGASLADVVRRAADDHRSLFSEAGVALDVRLPGAPVTISADATRIAQVVGNLLQNAAKFTPRGGHVALELTTRETHALLRVRDTGIGMDAEMLARLFEPFAQAEATVKSTVRTVLSARITKRRDLIELSIEADGFMKRMVRLIAGTLAQVGREKITPSQFRDILESGEKTKHVHAAPARGLYLKEVRY